MIDFIEEHRGVFGVEPICRVLPIAPSTYHQRALEAREPERASARSKSDAALRIEIARVWEENRELYGARKVWHALRREGFDVARCTVERLMKGMAIKGVVRGRSGDAGPSPPTPTRRGPARTTRSTASSRPCARTSSGSPTSPACRPGPAFGIGLGPMATNASLYVALIMDAWSRRVVGYAIGRRIDARLTLAALDAALGARHPPPGCIHHSDRGSQGGLNRSSQQDVSELTGGPRPGPRRASSSRASFGAER
jgi:putative transposase